MNQIFANKRNLIGIVVSILLITVGTWGQAHEKKAGKYDISEPALAELFNTVLFHMKNDYVDTVPVEELWFGAIRGMLAASDDPHTRFMTPDEYADLKVDTGGRFGGLGIEISIRDDILTVVSPIEDTPAMRAGLKPGDKIIEIEKEPTRDLTLQEAVKRLRGTPGSTVNITVAREGEDELLSFDIVRDIIKIIVVKSKVIQDENIGYIKLKQFSATATADLIRIIRDMKAQKVRGIILDLRWNPGGLLDAAYEISNLFIEEGVIVSTKGRRQQLNKVFSAQAKSAIAPRVPLVILVNEGSASASEIVTGAVKDHKRGTIVGTKTFGKGSVQSIIPLRHKAGIALTIQKYYTPSGESIHHKGIKPDVEVKPLEFSKEDRRNYRELREKKHIVKFMKPGRAYDSATVTAFKAYAGKLGLPLSDFAARYILKQETRKLGESPVYDLEFDVQLKEAIKQFK